MHTITGLLTIAAALTPAAIAIALLTAAERHDRGGHPDTTTENGDT